jgi:hypothetical protein
MILLQVYSEAGFEEQDEFFARRWDVVTDRPLAQRVWRLLEMGLTEPQTSANGEA